MSGTRTVGLMGVDIAASGISVARDEFWRGSCGFSATGGAPIVE
ncbi:MAG: hypothetical protein Q4P05_07925 [Actinomycetaceae bacterium]|nr:hypothetical protein [Actinomycetaceae bacterium]